MDKAEGEAIVRSFIVSYHVNETSTVAATAKEVMFFDS